MAAIAPAGSHGFTHAGKPQLPAPQRQADVRKLTHSLTPAYSMTSQKYDFRQFQEELAKLERKDERKVEPKIEPKAEKPQPSKPLGKKAAAAQRLAMAREEFQVLRKRHDLTVAEVVAFFPEEEGIAYLQQLIVAAQAKPRRTRKLAEVPTSD